MGRSEKKSAACGARAALQDGIKVIRLGQQRRDTQAKISGSCFCGLGARVLMTGASAKVEFEAIVALDNIVQCAGESKDLAVNQAAAALTDDVKRLAERAMRIVAVKKRGGS